MNIHELLTNTPDKTLYVKLYVYVKLRPGRYVENYIDSLEEIVSI